MLVSYLLMVVSMTFSNISRFNLFRILVPYKCVALPHLLQLTLFHITNLNTNINNKVIRVPHTNLGKLQNNKLNYTI